MGAAVAKVQSKLAREFEVESVLGSGAFGVVLKAKNKFDTASYAIKLAVQPPNSAPDKATNEIIILAAISSHQNVVSYKASWIDIIEKEDLQKLVTDVRMGAEEIIRLNFNLHAASLNILCIQMELCGPNLRTWMLQNIHNEERIDDRKRWQMFCQIVEGLQHIHHYKIIHRDLKPDNIFVCEQQVKIGDLGLAKVMPNNAPVHQNMTVNGTICYMAPEQRTSEYGKAVDIYSLGLVLAELFSFVKPEELPIFLFTIRAGIIPADIGNQWPEISALISIMVLNDPNERTELDVISKACKIIKQILWKDRHNDILCDGCQMDPIRGIRFKCKDCANFDFCENCKETVEHDPAHSFSPLTEQDTKLSRLRTIARLFKEISKIKSGSQDDGEDSSENETDCTRTVKCWKCKEKTSGMVNKCTECTNAYYCNECFNSSAKHVILHKFEIVDLTNEPRIVNSANDRINGILLEILLKAMKSK